MSQLQTTSARAREFRAAHERGDLATAVRLARTVAIRNILNGGVDYDVFDLTRELLGLEDIPRTPSGDVTWDDLSAHVYAAQVIGIAIGQLVHADVFKGGAQ